MGRVGQLLSFLAAAPLLTATVLGKEPSGELAGTQEEIGVYLAGVCQMNRAVRQAAESIVVRLYARIGVRLWFVNTRPGLADRDFISLRLLDRAPEALRYNVLGSALIEDHRGVTAEVFCDRLTQFYGAKNEQEAGTVLGFAMAHEIGHLLAGEPHHSAAGVMKAGWGPSDVQEMWHDWLGFDADDAARIHRGLAARRSAGVRFAARN